LFNRIFSLLILGALVLGGTTPAVTSAQDDSADNTVDVLAPEPYRDLVNALVEGFSLANTDVEMNVTYAEPDALMDAAAETDIVIYENFDELPPVGVDCGTISRAYAILPDLGARSLADCADYNSPDMMLVKDFLKYVASPDGQQIAIDMDYLPEAVEIEDQGGVTVTIPQPVDTVVSAYGVGTFYLYALGAGDRLAAAAYLGIRSDTTLERMRAVDPNFDTVNNALSVIGQRETNIEEMANLEPDLVLASARTEWLDTAEALDISILRFEGETPERFKGALTMLGTALGPNAAYRAEQFNTYYEATLDQIVAQTADIDSRPRVYFSGTEPLRVASGAMYQTAMVEAAGGVPVSKELPGFWNDVNLEQVIEWNPDVIFVPTYGGASVDAFTDSDEWQIVDAVADGDVYQLPQFLGPWDIPAPESILGIIWMAQILYPDQLDISCVDEVQYYYSMFYDYDMAPDLAQDLCE
jgi:iron complex transport system substrate-binding protein